MVLARGPGPEVRTVGSGSGGGREVVVTFPDALERSVAAERTIEPESAATCRTTGEGGMAGKTAAAPAMTRIIPAAIRRVGFPFLPPERGMAGQPCPEGSSRWPHEGQKREAGSGIAAPHEGQKEFAMICHCRVCRRGKKGFDWPAIPCRFPWSPSFRPCRKIKKPPFIARHTDSPAQISRIVGISRFTLPCRILRHAPHLVAENRVAE